MAELADPYEILGVARGASEDEIRSAYRRLARQFHPDRYVDAPPEEQLMAAERMRAINDAWEILESPLRRRNYDEATKPDPMRLVDIEAVLGPGFALKIWTSGGMTAESWGGARVNRYHPGTRGRLKGHQYFITAWAEDLSPLRKLYRDEVPGLWIVNGRDTGDEAMPHIGALPWLEVLDLRNTAVTSLGIAHLAGFDKLWSLNLSGTLINDKALEVIGTLGTLEELSLAGTSITDACMPDLLRLEKLEVLNLAHTNLSNNAAHQLLTLPRLRLFRTPRRVPLKTQWWAFRHRRDLFLTS